MKNSTIIFSCALWAVTNFPPFGGTKGGLLLSVAEAQNIAINTTGATPDASSMLDISATDKGLFIPRVALTATNSNAPIGAGIVTSLLVYNTATAGVSPNNVVPGYYYWNGTLWIAMGGPSGSDWALLGMPAPPQELILLAPLMHKIWYSKPAIPNI